MRPPDKLSKEEARILALRARGHRRCAATLYKQIKPILDQINQHETAALQIRWELSLRNQVEEQQKRLLEQGRSGRLVVVVGGQRIDVSAVDITGF